MTEAQDTPETVGWPVAAGRLAIGLAQGIGLWLLYSADQAHHWPATQATAYAALFFAIAMAPMILLSGLGRVRAVVLAGWTLAGALVVAGFAAFDRLNLDPEHYRRDNLPDPATWLAAIAFLFIAHHLIVPADVRRRWVAPYADYFDQTWKDAVQILLSLAFVGVMWIALRLGAELFGLIGISAFRSLLEREWFAFPITGVAFAAAVHLTDVRVALIRGVRTVGLVLLSWLLPLATLIAGAFLCALPFTGLEPLFNTRSAAAILLAAAAGLIVLINAAYQDGTEAKVSPVIRLAALVAAVAVVCLIGIALYAVSLRIGQYGLTPERVWALVCALVGAGYGLGYLAAAAFSLRGQWMRLLERVNLAMALVVLAMLAALFTPIADPARLSVDSQVSRLMAGKVTPEAFDYQFLRAQSGRLGLRALERLRRLSGGARNATIAQLASEAAINVPNPYSHDAPPVPPAERFTVYPANHALPAGFPAAPGPDTVGFRDTCETGLHCEAYIVDVDGDGAPEILVRPVLAYPGLESHLDLHRLVDGRWTFVGSIDICTAALDDLKAGRFSFEPAQGRDLVIAGRPFRVALLSECPAPSTGSGGLLQPGTGDGGR